MDDNDVMMADRIEDALRAQVAALEAEVARLRARPQLCVTALVTDDAGRLLLVRHRERGWEPVGGRVEGAEGWRFAAFREAREEAGVPIELLDEPPLVLEGQPVHGATFASVILVAKARASGEPRAADPDGKIVEARWFARDEVPLDGLSKIAIAEVVRTWVAQAKGSPTEDEHCHACGELGWECICPEVARG